MMTTLDESVQAAGLPAGMIVSRYRKTGIMAKILIVGCGDVGTRLATRLVTAGHEVAGLRRSSFALPGVTSLQGDVTDPASLHLPAGLDAVFIILSPDGQDAAAYRRTYRDGTRHVLAALAGQSLRHVFWVSSSSVYGQEDGSLVDESSPAAPVTATAQVLLESEELVRHSPWPATIVRCSGLYGPGRLRLLRWVESGRPVQAAPPQWTNRLHVDDAAGILAFLLEQVLAERGVEEVYIATDDQPVAQHEVLDWLADSMGLPHVAHVNNPGGKCNKRLSNQRLKALGYQWQYPGYREGYRSVLGTPPQ